MIVTFSIRANDEPVSIPPPSKTVVLPAMSESRTSSSDPDPVKAMPPPLAAVLLTIATSLSVSWTGTVEVFEIPPPGLAPA